MKIDLAVPSYGAMALKQVMMVLPGLIHICLAVPSYGAMALKQLSWCS